MQGYANTTKKAAGMVLLYNSCNLDPHTLLLMRPPDSAKLAIKIKITKQSVDSAQVLKELN